MTSHYLLDVLKVQQKHGVFYGFIYRDLQHILEHNVSVGDTRVRFVSRALRNRSDTSLRHVFLEFQQKQKSDNEVKKNPKTQECVFYVSEHSPETIDLFTPAWKDEFSIQLPNIPFELQEIVEFEDTLPSNYVFGMRDCRHHVSDVLRFCYPLLETN